MYDVSIEWRIYLMNDTEKSLLEHNKIKLLEPYKSAKAHHQMQCLTCEHIWSATPLSKKQTFKKYNVSGCPACNNKKRDTRYSSVRQQRLKELLERGIEVLDPTWDGRLRSSSNIKIKDDKILVRNTKCGHTFKVSPLNLIQSQVECAECGPTKRAEILTKWSKSNSSRVRENWTEWQIYRSAVSSLTRTVYNQNKKKINPTNLPRGKAGEEGAYHLDHIVPIKFCFLNNVPVESAAHPDNLQMIDWRSNTGSRDRIKGALPPIIAQYLKSSEKIEAFHKIIKTALPTVDEYVKFDMHMANAYHKESNTAFVLLSLDKSQGNVRSADKILKHFNDLGIRCILIFEDELAKVELIISKVRHITKQSIVERIHARKCIIKECTKKEKRDLLDRCHTQGNDAAQINIGAYYNGELVATMTFAEPRTMMGRKIKHEGHYELSRFCVDTKYRIPGISSKLLNYFKTHYDWTEIYSYADKRWSAGNVYDQLGFNLTADNPPAYFYVENGKRMHRWAFRKDALREKFDDYDNSKTELQMMQEHGYWRIYDCGTLRYTLMNNET